MTIDPIASSIKAGTEYSKLLLTELEFAEKDVRRDHHQLRLEIRSVLFLLGWHCIDQICVLAKLLPQLLVEVNVKFIR
jgi:hypothetical protein